MAMSLTEKLASVETKIKALVSPLNEAYEAMVAMVAAKADRNPGHPLYKAWKALDDRATRLRAEAADLRDEIEYAEED